MWKGYALLRVGCQIRQRYITRVVQILDTGFEDELELEVVVRPGVSRHLRHAFLPYVRLPSPQFASLGLCTLRTKSAFF
jgi:hypothetical protein